MDEIRQILKEVEEMHPYRIPSIRESYDKYAEGWTDAVNETESRLPVVPDTNVGNNSEIPNSSTLQPACNQLATDCIDRQAAIDAVRKSLVKEVTPAFMLIDKTEVMTELMMLPSARPKRKTREWIKVPRCEGDTQPDLKCPICGNVIGWWDLGRYCAGCGTKLEGGAG